MSKPMRFVLEDIRDTSSTTSDDKYRLKSCSITLSSIHRYDEEALVRAMKGGAAIEVRILEPTGMAPGPESLSSRAGQ